MSLQWPPMKLKALLNRFLKRQNWSTRRGDMIYEVAAHVSGKWQNNPLWIAQNNQTHLINLVRVANQMCEHHNSKNCDGCQWQWHWSWSCHFSAATIRILFLENMVYYGKIAAHLASTRAVHYGVKRTETHFDLCLNFILGQKVAIKKSRGKYFK